MSRQPDAPLPARGVLAGIRGDFKRAKNADGKYDPRGAGSAWSHAFLNQKPWHPLNFRNQIKKYDAEMRSISEAKAKEEAMAEFQAEQEYMKTLSYLSKEKQEEYKAKASVSFMYAKPPGLEAALEKEKDVKQQNKRKALAAPEGAGAGEAGGQTGSNDQAGQACPSGSAAGAAAGQDSAAQNEKAERAQVMDKIREDPFAAMLAARAALESSDKFVLKTGVGGRSQVHGGLAADAENQQFLVDDEEELGGGGELQDELGLLDPSLLQGLSDKDRRRVVKAVEKAKRAQEERKRVEEAEAVLRAAGYDVEKLRKESKKEKKSKKGKKHKKEKRHRKDGSVSDGSDDEDSRRHNEEKRHRREDGRHGHGRGVLGDALEGLEQSGRLKEPEGRDVPRERERGQDRHDRERERGQDRQPGDCRQEARGHDTERRREQWDWERGRDEQQERERGHEAQDRERGHRRQDSEAGRDRQEKDNDQGRHMRGAHTNIGGRDDAQSLELAGKVKREREAGVEGQSRQGGRGGHNSRDREEHDVEADRHRKEKLRRGHSSDGRR